MSAPSSAEPARIAARTSTTDTAESARGAGWTAVLRRVWRVLRQLSGEDAYERYLAHHRRYHSGEPVLDRRAFWCAEVERRWSGGVNRCC